jgi:hypothetical protein
VALSLNLANAPPPSTPSCRAAPPSCAGPPTACRRRRSIAANIDVAFVVTSLNADLNPRRIERYLAAAWQSGARPVVVLTKSDLCDDPQAQAAEIAALAAGCPVSLCRRGKASASTPCWPMWRRARPAC